MKNPPLTKSSGSDLTHLFLVGLLAAPTFLAPNAEAQSRRQRSLNMPPDNAPIRSIEGREFAPFSNPNPSTLIKAQALNAVPTPSMANWNPEGPFYVSSGQVENIPDGNPVIGAIHCVAPHPSDSKIIYIGAVNGGVWKTVNADEPYPHWEPLTDHLPSLSIGALEFDLTDSSYQTLVAGVGRFSSFARHGGNRVGIYRTTNGGGTWSHLTGGGLLDGKNISALAVNGSVIVLAVDSSNTNAKESLGIFRSIDSGATFQQISGAMGSGLPFGLTFDIDLIPGSSVMVTAVTRSDTLGSPGSNGIYLSSDNGATWSRISNTTINNLVIDNQTHNIEMAIGSGPSLFVSIINNGQLINGGIFYTDDFGSNWTQLDTPVTHEIGGDVDTNPRFKPFGAEPGGQGSIHFSIVADPTIPNLVYVGGDRQPRGFLDRGFFPNSIGAFDFSGRLFRGDISQASGSQWVHLTHSSSLGASGGGTASSSAPHADSRDMNFDADGNLLEVDDGGIYKRTSPRDNTGDWFSLNGDLQITEMHDIAYDFGAGVVLSGNQDTGTTVQSSNQNLEWFSLSTADGGDVLADDSTTLLTRRYSSFQSLAAFRMTFFDAVNTLAFTTFPPLAPQNMISVNPQFTTPLALNKVDPNRILIGGVQGLFESFDRGAGVHRISTLWANETISFGEGLAYGGWLGDSPNPNVIYALDFFDVYVRINNEPPSLASDTGLGAPLHGVILDPSNYNRAFVISDRRVAMTEDAGGSWTDITGDLNGDLLKTIEYVPGAFSDQIVVGGRSGVHTMFLSDPGVWQPLGMNLPNAAVWDMEYEAREDLLVIGTLGRGAWSLTPVAENILRPRGDFNADGVVNFSDFVIVMDAVRHFSNNLVFDLNEDGAVTVADARIHVGLFRNR